MTIEIHDTRLSNREHAQIQGMAFRVRHLTEGCYEAAMYDRPKFVRTDSPVSHGSGENIHEAKISAFLQWSRSSE